MHKVRSDSKIRFTRFCKTSAKYNSTLNYHSQINNRRAQIGRNLTEMQQQLNRKKKTK